MEKNINAATADKSLETLLTELVGSEPYLSSSSISTAATPATIGRLAAAHKGYAYQDLLCAYALVASLSQSDTTLTIDRKIVDDDRFDDLEIRSAAGRSRRQIKHSVNARTVLNYAMFNGAGSAVRFDHLVQTFVAEGDTAAQEYRLCATWQAPANDDRLAPAVEACSGPATVGQSDGPLLRLRADTLWPEGELPLLPCLATAQPPLAREDVVRFCDRFVIELNMPAASLDLDTPGALEVSLLELLSVKVGIGRYPNADRDPVDVAALAIHLAGTARAASATLTAKEIARRLAIRTDFGRIVQAFPLDPAVLQSRLDQRRMLVDAVGQGGHHLLLGAPGAGKSWLLTQVADDLKARGHIVARHYCFLEPGDSQLEHRVRTDVFFGNLLGELSDALGGDGDGNLAAGPQELEARLMAAVRNGTQVVLIIDGLDHIGRVRHSSVSLSDIDTDIVTYLAELRLPQSVTLLLGSQPGGHLDPLIAALGGSLHARHVVPWTATEVEGLARSHGLPAALATVGLVEPEAVHSTLALLAERSEGSPLYARYLIRGLQTAIAAGLALSPDEWLKDTPAIEGDIAAYYAHLYAKSSVEAQAIADLLGIIDFSVTEAEIVEIVGPFSSGWVSHALAALSPVLSQATSQGGVRIFHESFRRFMIERHQASGRKLEPILSPIIEWLDARGFFLDGRSYRFVFSLLVRAGREAELLSRVTHLFAQDSVAGGHPVDAIEDNLWLACDVAARRVDWESLMRFGELLRSVANCFEYGTNDWDGYWKAFVALHGAAVAVDRLLFDGVPTLPREQGLRICAIVDGAGEVAPWAEYFALPFDDDRDSPYYGSDLGKTLTMEEVTDLAAIRGRIRLGRTQRLLRHIHLALCRSEGELRPAFIRRLGKLLSDELSPELVEKMASRASALGPRRFSMPAHYACALLLGVADAASALGEHVLASSSASAALALASSPEEAFDCVERGASPSESIPLDDLARIDLGLEASGALLEATAVRRWAATVRLLAYRTTAASILDLELDRLDGAGWYRCWLRFVIASARVGAAQQVGASIDPSLPFSELTHDMHPFTGSPRAMDLYAVRHVILEGLAAGMAQLRTTQDWQNAMRPLLDARRHTESRLDHEDGGPVSTQDLFRVLQQFESYEPARDVVNAALEELLHETETWGTYYSTHAVLRMHAVELVASDPDKSRANLHWRRATQFLLGYGYRKDPTLYDLVESAPALAVGDPAEGRRALAALQPLVIAAYRHTDTKGTRGLPNAWYKALLKVDPVLALSTLSRSLENNPLRKAWWVESALTDALSMELVGADALVLDALWTTVPFEVEYQNESAKCARQRLAPLERLMSSAPAYARERFTRLCAEVANDSHNYLDEALAELFQFARRHGLQWQGAAIPYSPAVMQRGAAVNHVKPILHVFDPALPAHATYADLAAAVRRAAADSAPSQVKTAALVTSMSYHITAMVDAEAEHRAARLVRLFAEEPGLWYDDDSRPLPMLANCLEQSGHLELAVVAYTLAFTSARGGRGWLTLGDQTSSHLLDRALDLNPAATKSLLAWTVAQKYRTDEYFGTPRSIIEQLARWEAPDVGRRTWWAAFEVQESRLPLPGPTRAFQEIDGLDVSELSINEALVGVILARISEPVLFRKTAALAAFRRLLAREPLLFAKSLAVVLTLNSTVSTVQAILLSLVETPQADNRLIELLRAPLELYAQDGGWVVSLLAGELLSRIGYSSNLKRTHSAPSQAPASNQGHALMRMGNRRSRLLATLQEIWPDLPATLASIMSGPTYSNEHTMQALKERWRIECGRDRDAHPVAPVLSWPEELFIAALDDELARRAAELPAGCSLPKEISEAVIAAMIPRVWLHISVEASRVPRPAWPVAYDVKSGVSDTPCISDPASQFFGWRRLAWHEIAVKRTNRHGRPELLAEVRAGVVSAARPAHVPAQAEPLIQGFGGDEWWEFPTVADAGARLRFPQPMACDLVDDLLGRHIVINAPSALLLTLDLTPSSPGEPFFWEDRSGQQAVVMRSWRVRGHAHDVENYEVKGVDVIVRPDVFEHLADLAKMSLHQLSRVDVSRLPS